MSLISLLDRYIARSILYSTLLVSAILLGLFIFVIFIDEFGDLGKGQFDLNALIKYVILSLPSRIYELFPSIALLGVVLGLTSLALGSELTVMRAAGVSLLRIIGSVMKIGLVFIIGGVLIGETVVPVSDTWAERGRAEALQVGLHREATGLWLRDGADFVNIGEVLPDLTLLNVNIYRFEPPARLRTHTSADRAHFEDNGWRLANVNKSTISDDAIRRSQSQNEFWQSVLTPDVVGVFTVRPGSLSTLNLYHYIQHLRRNHQDTARYQLVFWNKVLLPAATAVMILLAVPFVFGQMRSGAMGQKVFVGIMIGLAFNVLNRGFGHVGLLYGLPTFLAAVLPVAIFLLLALYLLRRVA
jgi:lipopolysaccharide export system permease protein